MEISYFKHEGVRPDGTFYDKAGAVHTDGRVVISQKHGGCDIETCSCSEGHWITKVGARTHEGIVKGFTATFDNRKELEEYLSTMN